MAKKNISGDPSTIGRTIRIQGSLEGDEDLRILGKIEGDLDLNAHHLIIGEGAQVDGNVRGRAITVEGHVLGRSSQANCYTSRRPAPFQAMPIPRGS